MEVERLRDRGALVLEALELLEALLELLLEALEVRHRLSLWWHEGEQSVKRLRLPLLGPLSLFFSLALTVLVLLHARGQLCQRERCLCIALHALLASVLGSLDHLLVERGSHTPRDDASLEWLIDRLHVTLGSLVLSLFLVSQVEPEGLLPLFRDGEGHPLNLLATLLIGGQDLLILRLLGALGNVVCFKAVATLLLYPVLFLFDHFFQLLLSDRLVLLGAVEELKDHGDSDVILAFSVLGNHLFLIVETVLQLSLHTLDLVLFCLLGGLCCLSQTLLSHGQELDLFA